MTTTPLHPDVHRFLAMRDPTRDDVHAFVTTVARWFGPGFHPDTPAEEYVHVASGERMFSAVDAAAFERARELMFKFDDVDPSSVAFTALYPGSRGPPPARHLTA